MGATWPNLGPRCAPDSLTLLNIGPTKSQRKRERRERERERDRETERERGTSPAHTQTQIGRRTAVRRKPHKYQLTNGRNLGSCRIQILISVHGSPKNQSLLPRTGWFQKRPFPPRTMPRLPGAPRAQPVAGYACAAWRSDVQTGRPGRTDSRACDTGAGNKSPFKIVAYCFY